MGAGKLSRLPTLYQRTVLFLLIHCIPIATVMWFVPQLLCDPSADPSSQQLSSLVAKYIMYIIPGIFLEALSR